MTTIVYHANSGCFASRAATAAAAPLEMPLRIPSSRARRWAVSMASSLVMVSTRSTTERSNVSGIMPAPMPWISYVFRSFRVTEPALYHSLGKLPEPELTHRFF